MPCEASNAATSPVLPSMVSGLVGTESARCKTGRAARACFWNYRLVHVDAESIFGISEAR